MGEEHWCDPCRDWFPVSHYAEDGMYHRAGPEYGPEGYYLACTAALRRIAERIGDDPTALAADLRSLIGDDLLAAMRKP